MDGWPVVHGKTRQQPTAARRLVARATCATLVVRGLHRLCVSLSVSGVAQPRSCSLRVFLEFFWLRFVTERCKFQENPFLPIFIEAS